MKNLESLIATRVANYLKTTYSNICFRFDLVDQLPTIGSRRKNKELHGSMFATGFPDLVVYGYGKPLFIELKKDTKSGNVPNTAHTRRQTAFHNHLRGFGYECDFAVGYEQAVEQIDKYMKKSEKRRVKNG